jgi:transcription termination/antitermination protein NusA
MADDDDEKVARLFAQEVPEIAAGVVEIKAIARKCGARTKLAVQRAAPGVDAIGVCVGERGCRMRRIVEQLAGERIDLVLWDDSPQKLIANALQPARIEQVILHPAEHRATVIVRKDQLSFVAGSPEASRDLGASGDENRELASGLSGWQIEVVVQ